MTLPWATPASGGAAASKARSTVAVVGLGNIGAAIAGSLCDANRHDIIACTRRPMPRLILERDEGTVEVPLCALTDPAQARPVDWVLLCTKAHQTPAVAPWLQRLCGPHTRVAVLQNGIEQPRRVGPFVGEATVVPTIVYYNGERIPPDRVRLRRVAKDDLAVREDADGRAFAALLAGTPLHILLSAEFDTLAWRKLLINAVANPMTALTLQRQAVLRHEDIRALSLAVLEEAVAVARAAGVHLAEDEPARVMATVLTYPPEAGTSMYFDRLAGRTLEADPLTGAIVEAGRRHGIPTPLNSALLALMHAINDAAEKGGQTS